MLCRLVVLLALSGADALQLGAAASRRSFLTKAAAAAGSLAVSAPVFAAPVLDNTGKGAMSGTRGPYQAGGFDTQGAASKKSFDGGKLRKSAFDGKFSDPAHSGLTRTLETIGGRDIKISGADEDGKKWSVLATRKNSKTIVADFTPKGGPDSVVVTAQINGDLSFPDGNVWKKI